MRYIETLSKRFDDRLHARTEHDLKRKVASSDRSEHTGYPDDLGLVPHIVIDPEHQETTDPDANLCSDADAGRATTFTATLGFPHLAINKAARNCPSVQRLATTANVDANAVLETGDETVKTVLHERERLRMRAVADGHEYALDDETELTADPIEKLLINAARAAERRNGPDYDASDVREVIEFKRNSHLREALPFDTDAITDEFLADRIGGKTCSPPLPQTEEHQTVLLYYIDNPDATITEVVEETGINRGKFETFRLNRPNPTCYDRDHIASLTYDEAELTAQLHEWMDASPHPVYDCADCDAWYYSERSLAIHKSNSADHARSAVNASERPDDGQPAEAAVGDVEFDTDEDGSVDDLLAVYSEITEEAGDDEPDADDSEVVAGPVEADVDSEPQPDTTDDDRSSNDSAAASTSTTPGLAPPSAVVDALESADDPIEALVEALDTDAEDIFYRIARTLDDGERRALVSGAGGASSDPRDLTQLLSS